MEKKERILFLRKDKTPICDATIGHLIDATRKRYQILFAKDLGRITLLRNIIELIKKRDMESLAKILPMIEGAIKEE